MLRQRLDSFYFSLKIFYNNSSLNYKALKNNITGRKKRAK